MFKTAIIGSGNMGYAILKGMAQSGKYDMSHVTVADKRSELFERAKACGAITTLDPAEAVSGADYIILAVKPQGLMALAEEIKDKIPENAVVTSILAGKRIEKLREALGDGRKIIRVMPNTPALSGMGMSGICRSENVSDEELSFILEIFGSFGIARVVEESLMDTVTGISGSGPAYVFMFIDGLIKTAVKHGMTPEDARVFAIQTVMGSAKMAMESEDTPERLKINVCSPGGTTIEAVAVFEKEDMEGMIDRAVDACIEKSKILGK